MIYQYSPLYDIEYPSWRDIRALNKWAVFAEEVITNAFGKYCLVNLIGTGTSGAVLCSMIASIRPDSFVVIYKKKDENTHRNENSLNRRDKFNQTLPIIIVDDHVSTGRTLATLIDKTEEHFNMDKIDLLIAKDIDCSMTHVSHGWRIRDVVAGRVVSNDYKEYEKNSITQITKPLNTPYEAVKPTESIVLHTI